MKKFYVTCIASMIALGSIGAFAADMTSDERSELRERANSLSAERQRNPGWDGGARRVNESRGDVKLNQNRGEVKNQNRGEVNTKVDAGKPKTKSQRAKNRIKRTAKEMPGALVRPR